MGRYSSSRKVFLCIFSSVFLIFSTTAYADIGGNLNYMESDKDISIFRLLSVSVVVITLVAIFAIKYELTSRRSVFVGALLTIFGLLHIVTQPVNYMVIGMGLIALSGVLLAYENGVSKLIYILGLLFISAFASIEFGTGVQFIYNVGLLYIIGAGLLLFVSDESSKRTLSYESEVPITREALDKQLKQFSKVRDNFEKSEHIDFSEKKIAISRVALIVILAMVVMLFVFVNF